MLLLLPFPYWPLFIGNNDPKIPPMFAPRQVCVVLVVNRLTMERSYLGVFRFFPFSIIQPMFHTYISFIYHGHQITFFFYHGAITSSGPRPPHYGGFTITLRPTTLGTTPLDEWPDWRRDLYLTTHNTHKRQTSIPPAGFEPTFPANERPMGSAYITLASC
jgi:hypothetical protein